MELAGYFLRVVVWTLTKMKSHLRSLASTLVIIAMTFAAPRHAEAQSASANRRFVGSEACKKCHAEHYEGWMQTRMANVIREPKQHPEAVLGDFAQPNPVGTFSLDDVASFTAADGSNAFSPRKETTTSLYLPSGT